MHFDIASDTFMSGLVKAVAAATVIGGGGVVLTNSAVNQEQNARIYEIRGELHVIRCGVFKETPQEKLECIGDPNN